jgi:hypothetical protein
LVGEGPLGNAAPQPTVGYLKGSQYKFENAMLAITKYFIKGILNKQCVSTVPRSGKEGEAVNCFHTYLYTQNEPYMVILHVEENEITGKLWTMDGFKEEVRIPFEDLKKYQVRITHYYGLYDTKYIGLLDYALTGYTKFDSLKCTIHKLLNNTKQYVFNKKKLATFDRLEILRALIDLQFCGNASKFMTMDLMTHIYSYRWIMHPDKDSQEHILQVFVDSFVESGELDFDGSCSYSVTGKAINTLSEYEEQERRHLENKRLQRRMLFLTLAIVLVGIIQALITYYK